MNRVRGIRSVRRPVSIVAVGLMTILASSSLVWGAGIADLVEGYGLAPISPPRPAADFTLPRFSGGEGSLSDFAGEWVILTFWASWCGPCRAEMPSLEALHQSHAQKGVVVLGVSVDQSDAAARSFLDEHLLTFPQLWDSQGRVGSVYQASAIPMSLLVDPEGRIVALSRGARDWSQLSPLMDALIETVPPRAVAQTAYAETLDFSGVADPPTAEVTVSKSLPRPGEEFFVDIHLRWAGRLEEYLPQPPRVHLPEGVRQKGVTASTSSHDGAQVVVYRLTLQADEAGTFALDPVELRYQPRMAADVAITQIQGPTITVAARTVAGVSPRTFALIAGGVAATALVGLAVGSRWKSRRTPDEEEGHFDFEPLTVRFQEVRALRMQGDAAGFCLGMLEILEEIDEPGETEASARAKLREDLRFGGHVPQADEMDRWQREVGRRLETLRPDPQMAARDALRLHDDEESS